MGEVSMHIRNGIKTTLRSRLRTILFTALIIVLTLVLTLGIEMWGYCVGLMGQLDESYTTIVLAEYMGEEYPDDTVADENAREALEAIGDEDISSIAGVKLWERTKRMSVLTDNYRRPTNTSPYNNFGVLVASRLQPMYVTDWHSTMAEYVDLPETRLEVNYNTQIARLYTSGLEALELKVYILYENSYYLWDNEHGYLEETIAEEDLPETYLLQDMQNHYLYETRGYSLVGEVPEGYDRTAPLYLYYYTEFDDGSPATPVYEFYGQYIDGYSGSISRAIYTSGGEEGVFAFFSMPESFVPENGKRYLMHGMFISSGSANRRFWPMYYHELTGDDDPELFEGEYIDYANLYRNAASFAEVDVSADISSLEPFQQGAQYLTEGRFPMAGEAGVCIISGSTAERIGVGLGDTVSISMLSANEWNRYNLTETGDVRNWEIVGITNSNADYSGRFWVTEAEDGESSYLFGYELGRALLDNRLAGQALEELRGIMPENVRLTLYDQGYSAASKPIQDMRTAAIAVTVAAAGGAFAVLFLFAYLFVGRQRETVQVLVSLGTPSGKIRLWLLSGAALIVSVSSALGAVLGHLSIGKVIDLAMSAAQSMSDDIRYSNAALGLVKEAPAAASVPGWYAAASALAIFAVSMILCIVFLQLAKKQSSPKKGKTTVHVPTGKTSLFGRGAPRFAFLSTGRGGWRSAIVPVAALVLTLLLGLLTMNAAGWQTQLDEVYTSSDIKGQMVSTDGRTATKLSVPASNVREVWHSESLEDFAVSLSWNYREVGAPIVIIDGTVSVASPSRQPELVALNSLSAAPEFYYSEVPDVEWLEGWDESFLADNEYYNILYSYISFDNREFLTYPALVSSSCMEDHELSLGDEWTVQVELELGDRSYDIPVPIKIVGSFRQEGIKQNIYVPLSFWFDPEWITGDEAPVAEGERVPLSYYIATTKQLDKYVYFTVKFRTCRFGLRSAYDLEPFRKILADGEYSQVGKLGNNRVTVLLLDQSFQKAVGGLKRYITFGKILFPVLFLAVGLLGFIISRLMVNGRRMEFAIMRGLGASRGRVFASFFLEQGTLCAVGGLLGALTLTFISPVPAIWFAAAGFLVCYLAGCAFAILAVGRTKLMSLLSERE